MGHNQPAEKGVAGHPKNSYTSIYMYTYMCPHIKRCTHKTCTCITSTVTINVYTPSIWMCSWGYNWETTMVVNHIRWLDEPL